ncbi:MAG: sensor histidine kinase KdpD, partial [Acidobacteriia bacterium]|nr:sensor histidine kinase KdpD [Terriglobia bacterium]
MVREAPRKTPEQLLQQCQAEEAAATKGHLKIFLGYASGVGKSFRMLDEARRRKERGQDVVVGGVQSKMQPEEAALLQKLEVVPLKPVNAGSAVDVETLLRRHPAVCFIDGLAYDNPSGARNPTRWQDADELLRAGIKVIASINIQYVAELSQQVEAITGKHVTQTVPVAFIKS